MKKLSLIGAAMAAMIMAGCDTEIQLDEVKTFDISLLCGMSGGDLVAITNELDGTVSQLCKCGDEMCDKDILCVPGDKEGDLPQCSGKKIPQYPSGICPSRDAVFCFNDANGNGHEVTCNMVDPVAGDTRLEWSAPQPCTNGHSCMVYPYNVNTLSTRCGECKENSQDNSQDNNGKSCHTKRLLSASSYNNTNQVDITQSFEGFCSYGRLFFNEYTDICANGCDGDICR